jgi:hypothetical protein
LTIDSEGVRIHEYREEVLAKTENRTSTAMDKLGSEAADDSDFLEEAEYESVG